jgi:hypothetical protein
MTKTVHAQQLESLRKSIGTSIKSSGEQRLKEGEAALSDVLVWLDYLQKSETTGCCNEMIIGIHSAGVEAAGTIAVGLVRSAIFAMRGQIDLAVAWLFFKDHPVEWEHMLRTGEEFKLKGEIFDFFATYRPKFPLRLALLQKYKTRKLDDPYRILSAHIHVQSTLVMPKFSKLEALIYPEKRCAEALQMQREVSEYISDLFLAYFGDKWASLPSKVVAAAQSRVPADKQPILFS